MKVLIFGRGFMGAYIARELGAIVAVERLAEIENELRRHRPDVVINAAGVTGSPNVDACESDAVRTMDVNVVQALLAAQACARAGVHLIHLGSGCIFYGLSPRGGAWSENDFALPQSTYSVSKWAADLALRQLPNVTILRMRMPVSDEPHQRNLITKLAGYKKVIDVSNSITVREDLPAIIRAVIEKRAFGIFHCTRPNAVSHMEILESYSRIIRPLVFERIPEENLWPLGLIERPRSSVHLTSRLPEIGLHLPPLYGELDSIMRRYKERL